MSITWKDVLLALVPLVIVGGLAALLVLAPKAPELAYAPVEHTGSEVVTSGQPFGDEAIIDAVITKTNSFVTIHESLSGAPAQVIGTSSLLPPGEYENIRISLTQDTLPGYRYIVLLMEDNGNGVFDLGVDLPIMSEGTVIKRDFVTEGGENE